MNSIAIFAIVLLGGIGALAIQKLLTTESWQKPKSSFPKEWRRILIQKVNFYNALNKNERNLFEFKVQEFLLNCKVTGIEVSVNDTDKVLVAASGVIPIFKFPKWRYTNLFEVILYPAMFNLDFETTGPDRNILGMVGTGYMEGKMILSKPALHHGFDNDTDKRNTAIHEFIHLIDKMDGSIDGIPSLLLEQPYLIPWIDLINHKMDDIYEEKSDINPYGGSKISEFFPVVCEYFFERPKLLSSKHPKLYKMLVEIFDQDMDERNLKRSTAKIGRNSPCPCNSGMKFKKCCGRIHYS